MTTPLSRQLADALRRMVNRWEPDAIGTDRVMWENACDALAAFDASASDQQPADDPVLNLIAAQGLADRALSALLTCRRIVHRDDKLARHLFDELISTVVDPLGEMSQTEIGEVLEAAAKRAESLEPKP